MARITNIKTGKSEELKSGEQIRSACEKLGVPFSCGGGICGACTIDVVQGEDNLSDLTKQEKDFMKDKKHRLACQCRIKGGEVKFRMD